MAAGQKLDRNQADPKNQAFFGSFFAMGKPPGNPGARTAPRPMTLMPGRRGRLGKQGRFIHAAALAACAVGFPLSAEKDIRKRTGSCRKRKERKIEIFFGRDFGDGRRSYKGCCFGAASEYHENRSDEPHDLEPIPPQTADRRGGIPGRGAPGRARRRAPDRAGRGLCALCRGG